MFDEDLRPDRKALFICTTICARIRLGMVDHILYRCICRYVACRVCWTVGEAKASDSILQYCGVLVHIAKVSH
jgi:hypothetical protein